MNKKILILSTKEIPRYYETIKTELDNAEIGYELCVWEDYTSNIIYEDIYSLVMVINSEYAPHSFICDVEEYLQRGRKIVVLGGVFLNSPLYKFKDNFISYNELIEKLSLGEFDKKIINSFSKKEDIQSFIKDTNNPDSKEYNGSATFIAYNYDIQCVRYNTNDFYINENFEGDISVTKNHNAIAFYLKAIAATRTVTVQLVDEDGIVWKKTICPNTDWEYVLLSKKDFTPSGIRGSMKRPTNMPIAIDFSKVRKILFGHAVSHAYSVAGTHTFYIRELSSFNIDEDILPNRKIDIDGLYPEYKYYPVTNAKKLVVEDTQNIVPKLEYTIPSDLFSMSVRQNATGVNKDRNSRFIPLIEVYDDKNLRSGFLAYTILNLAYGERKTKYQGSNITVFTTNDEEFYNNNGAKAVIDAIKFMIKDTFLIEGGTDEYMYRTKSDKGSVGVVVALKNNNTDIDTLKISIEYYTENININQNVLTDVASMELVYQDDFNCYYKYLSKFIPTNADITVTLFKDDVGIDILKHNIEVYEQKPLETLQFAHIKDNEVFIGDKMIRFYGVNYMPSASIGSTYGDAHEHYVSTFSYDPDLIYKELLRVREVGLNAVSLFITYNPSIKCNNILHLIEMCRKLGLYVDLSIRPHANPFDFNEVEVEEMIKKYSFHLNDNIISYDIAWERYFGTYEPCYGNYFGRKAYNSQWETFLVDRYGSISSAEKSFGCEVPKDENGDIIGVSDRLLRVNDDVHLKLVTAYRYFANNLIANHHIKAKEFIKSIDKNHLISPRTGDASTIPLVDPGIFGYDYKSISSMDFFSPESYALSDDNKILRQGTFTNIYSRYARPNSVVMWKEFGKSIWVGSNFKDNTISKGYQAEFYRKFFDMLILGHTSGLFAWWWSGGYRIGENSDFGIVNPDGSDREVTTVFREYYDKFMLAPMLDKDFTTIKIDRDKHQTGLLDIYKSIEEELFERLDKGENVKIIDDAYEKTSKNIDAIGVGNTEYTHRAHKHMDCVYKSIIATLDNGKKVVLKTNDSLHVGDCKSIEISINLINIDYTIWSFAEQNPNAMGTVVLTNAYNSFYKFKETLSKSVNYQDEIEIKFTIDCTNKGLLAGGLNVVSRFDFGEQFYINITD